MITNLTEVEIIDAFLEVLKTINTSNGYLTNFDKVVYWETLPTEYNRNYLILRDGTAFFEEKGNHHEISLDCEVIAVLFGENAARLGSIALRDLLGAVGRDRTMGINGLMSFVTKREKLCDTEGRSACEVILEVVLKYRVPLFNL